MLQRLRNRKGQGMSEYLIILALVAIATVGAVVFFADNVRQQLHNLGQEISGTDATVSTNTGFEDVSTYSYELDNYAESDQE